LNETFFFSISLPRLTPRYALESGGKLEARHSRLFELDHELAESFGRTVGGMKRKSLAEEEED
jgi:hypothetical protein